MIRRAFSSKNLSYCIGPNQQIVEFERDWKELLKFVDTEGATSMV